MNRPIVSVYYFPNYHVDPQNEAVHGTGWTEWELVKRATPRFPGHRQPRIPLWGYEDESDPKVMARKIDAAADHGVDQFIFDWYWYANGPFLNRALERGFMKSSNCARLSFSLMWANHDWMNMHPVGRSGCQTTLLHGKTTRVEFERIVDYVVENYFRHPSYQLIDGCPYFSIYELMSLIESLGGVESTRDGLEYFRAKTRSAGFPDLHFNAVLWGIQVLPSDNTITDPTSLAQVLGLDSVTSYVWVHHIPLDIFPETDYSHVLRQSEIQWSKTAHQFPIPYHPNVTMGWDSSPRTIQSEIYENTGYPFMARLAGNTPAKFEEALNSAKEFLKLQPHGSPLLTINAWNEWTEGSYLEPDTEYGMGYLEAIRRVFC